MRPGRTLSGLAIALAWMPQAQALDLVEAWQGALQHAPQAAVAAAARQAGDARTRQARALWRPSVALEGGAGLAGSETSTSGARFSAPGFGQSTGVGFDTSVTDGRATRYALALRQPVYSREREARSRALEIAGEAAEVQWSQARQDLMIDTVKAYFDAAVAVERLNLLARLQEAVAKAAAEAAERFRLGDRPVTDVHEANARLASLQAERLEAQTRASLARSELDDLTGLRADTSALLLPREIRREDLGSVDAWLARAERRNPSLALSAAQAASARAQATATRAAFSPTVDVVAQVARERITGDGDFGRAGNASRNGTIGVQLTVPLYTGGLRSAQDAENTALVAKATAELERARVQVAQQTRAAWLDLSTGQSRLAALAAALQASRQRLDATRVGLQAGDRTTLDLLNAENDALTAELTLLSARVRLLADRLRLSAIVGELDEAALSDVNAQLRGPAR